MYIVQWLHFAYFCCLLLVFFCSLLLLLFSFFLCVLFWCLCVIRALVTELRCSDRSTKRWWWTWILLRAVGIWFGWDMISLVCRWMRLQGIKNNKHQHQHHNSSSCTFADQNPWENFFLTSRSTYYRYLFWVSFIISFFSRCIVVSSRSF